MSIESSTIKVFVSYSHNASIPDYKDRILALADRLRSDGIDCTIDQYQDSPPEGWPRWMLNQVEVADFVLVACSEEYDRRFRGNEAYGKGKGATWEGGVIIQELYDAQGLNSKFIPITLNPEDSKFIPSPLRGATYYKLQSHEGYDLLYRRLTDRHDTPMPPLGTVRELPVRDRADDSSLDEKKVDRVEAVKTSSPAAIPSTRSIRQLVEDALSDDLLSDLCQDEFPQVFKQFTTGQTKSHRIRLLVEYVERQRETSKLLNAVERVNSTAHQELIGDKTVGNKTQANLVQHNSGNAQGFQTEVRGGTVYIGGTHTHGTHTPPQSAPSASSLETDINLSKEARELLLAAFESSEKIIKVSTIKNFGGPTVIIRANNRTFGSDRESLTNYQYALEQLAEEDLLDRVLIGDKTCYKLKRKGFNFCIKYNKPVSLLTKALALQTAVNQQIETEIAELKAIGQPIYYSKNGKLIREAANGKKFEYRPLPDGGEEIMGEVTN